MVPELENYLMWTMGVGFTLQAWDRVQESTLISLSGAAAKNSVSHAESGPCSLKRSCL